jgi:hypothetical protein
MALFIYAENQKLLWNIIKNNETINFFFVSNPHINRENWFRSIVQHYYEGNKHKTLTTNDLLLLNKEVLAYMSKNIKDNLNQRVQVHAPAQVSQTDDFLKPYSVTESRVDKIGNKYSEKQNEYQSLFDKKVPENIDFREKEDDKPISNMDELIQKHMRERESELLKYSPLPVIPQTNKLVIENQPENINIQIETLEDTKTKKSVTWSDNTILEKLDAQRQEIDTLKSQVLELLEKMKYLENKI